ncbi:MAG: transposase family protein, partial [Acidimicrobiia bacterium]|nr:transposase family protein [Acidimicrobiia bacterium]
EADHPGDLVQMDCFHVGSFKETRLGVGKQHRGVVWQYTAIDVASSYVWVRLASSAHNPTVENTTRLVRQVAADLSTWGWHWKAASTDNGNEFRARAFGETLTELDVTHRFIRAGRPQSNGKVERVQGTILEEFYQPTLLKYVEPSITGLRRDLDAYITYYNHQRPHFGKWNKGKPPSQIIQPKTKLTP